MPRTCPRSLEATAVSLPRQKTSDAGSRSEGLQALPKLMRTPETNAFPSSPSEKQKQIHSPTKSPLKKTKQKCSDITPMDEGSANPWKTVMNKSACVAGHVAKQLIQGNESDDVWLSDEEMSSDEVKFIKKTNAFVETVDSSSDEDDSVEILGVKNPDKTNYYAKLTTSKTEYNTDKEKDEEEDNDASVKTSSSYKEALLNKSNEPDPDEPNNNEDRSDVSTSEDESEEYSLSSGSEMSSNASSCSTKKKQKKNKNNKNGRRCKNGGKKGKL